MIRLKHEQVLGLAKLARRLSEIWGGRPTSPTTIVRWINVGVLGKNGDRVPLEGFKMGGRWFSSEEALQRWIERLNADPALGRTPTTADADATARTDEELTRLGF